MSGIEFSLELARFSSWVENHYGVKPYAITLPNEVWDQVESEIVGSMRGYERSPICEIHLMGVALYRKDLFHG